MVSVYASGTWDMFHIGHLNFIKESYKLGDKLVIGVSTDKLVNSYKHKRPIIPYKDRFEIVESCKYIDEVVKQDKLMDVDILKQYEIDIVTIGSDWKNKYIEGLQWAKDNLEVVFIPYTKGVSSSILRDRLIDNM